LARHNSNHKGKATGCVLCSSEEAVDKIKKSERKRREYGWKTEKRSKPTLRTS
jgi:hypothetical protein